MRNLELVRKIGDGSAVEAFLGREGSTHYLVQVSRPELGQAAEVMGRFLDSSKSAVDAAPHPELLTAREVTMTEEGRFWLRSEAITGWTAADLLSRGPLPEPMVVDRARWSEVLLGTLDPSPLNRFGRRCSHSPGDEASCAHVEQTLWRRGSCADSGARGHHHRQT